MSTHKWMSKLVSDFGQLASEMPAPTERVVSLPSPSLNWAVSNGGITAGKIVTLYGPESGGKSLLMQLLLIQLQNDNPEGIVILFDAEFAFNKNWFQKLGGDLNRLIVKQTNDPLKIFDYIERDLLALLQDGCPIVGIAIDSVKAIRYPKDMKQKSTDLTMGGGGASYLGPAFKAIIPVIRTHNITTILVQQVYEEMDAMKKLRNPFLVPDGRALKHASDYMLEVTKQDTKAGSIVEGASMTGSELQVGHKVRVRVKKNRLGPPNRIAEFSLHYEHGIIDTGNEAFTLAKALGVVYHPVNPSTGKENPQMWQFRDYDAVRGEANIRDMIIADPTMLRQMIEDCSTVKDEVVKGNSSLFEAGATDVKFDESLL